MEVSITLLEEFVESFSIVLQVVARLGQIEHKTSIFLVKHPINLSNETLNYSEFF